MKIAPYRGFKQQKVSLSDSSWEVLPNSSSFLHTNSMLLSFAICSFSVMLESVRCAQLAALFVHCLLVTIEFPLRRKRTTGEYWQSRLPNKDT